MRCDASLTGLRDTATLLTSALGANLAKGELVGGAGES